LRVATLGVSPTNDVIVGRETSGEDWLYYQGTANDYLGSNLMSDDELLKAANNLAKMQSTAETNGAKFLFVIAPNKNSIYPENMPSNYLETEAATNSERLMPYLEAKNVNYLNLFEVLRKAKEDAAANANANTNATASASEQDTQNLLYFKTDSHWNNKGALIASNAICETLGIEPLDNPSEWISRTDHLGELESMLYPTASALEADSYYGGINDEDNLTGVSWSYTNNVQSTFDETITTSGMGTASMLVYRDSFCNALLPYLATQSSEAYFSRLVPYDTELISKLNPDYVIVERAERHLNFFADKPLL
jgi:hypothetical protein